MRPVLALGLILLALMLLWALFTGKIQFPFGGSA
jgi:hypothetical protein